MWKHLSYRQFKLIFGDLGLTNWVKYNWLSKIPSIWNEKWESGSYNTSTGEKEDNTAAIRNIAFIKIKANTKYFAKSLWGLRLYFYNSQKKYISTALANNTYFTTPATAAYMNFNEGNAVHPVTSNLGDIAIYEGQYDVEDFGFVDLSSLVWTKSISVPHAFYSDVSDLGYKFELNVPIAVTKYKYIGTVANGTNGLAGKNNVFSAYYQLNQTSREFYIRDLEIDESNINLKLKNIIVMYLKE